MSVLARVASLDFGPVHTAILIADIDRATGVLRTIVDWRILDWRGMFVRARGNEYRPFPEKPIDSLRVDQLRELLRDRHLPFEGLKRRDLLAAARSVRDTDSPLVKDYFFGAYAEHVAMVHSAISDLIGHQRPWDYVVYEHQASHFRYENCVLEAMVASAIHSIHLERGFPAPQHRFEVGAYKYRKIRKLLPRPPCSETGTTVHARNKAYSVQATEHLLLLGMYTDEQMYGPAYVFFGLPDKQDDLADVFLQLWQFLTEYQAPVDCLPSTLHSP